MTLTYEEAYNRLIKFMEQKYWRLQKIDDAKLSAPSKKLHLYEAQENGQVRYAYVPLPFGYQLPIGGFGDVGKQRLNPLLKNIHATCHLKNLFVNSHSLTN